MTTFSKVQERSYTETFSNVMTLYSALKEEEYKLRTSRNKIDKDSLDFVYDVQLKVRRVLNGFDAQVFLRMADAGNYALATPETKLALGHVFTEFGLDIDGIYKIVYYHTKNEQVRQFLKAALREPLENNHGRCIE